MHSCQALSAAAAVVGLVALVAAVMFLAMPVATKNQTPDWAAVWAMRWTAVGAVATAVTMLAIVVTAFYAARAIETTLLVEKSKRTAELIAAYHSRGIVDAQFRVLSVATASATDCLREFHILAGFTEECAIAFFANLVDKNQFLSALDYAVNNAWLSVHYVLIPAIERNGTWTDTSQSDKLRFLCIEHLTQRLAPEARSRLVQEEENFKRIAAAADDAPNFL